MKISVSSYSFNQYLKAGKLTLVELPKLAHEIGFDGIEFIELENKSWGITEDPMKTAGEIREAAVMLFFGIDAVYENIHSKLGSLVALLRSRIYVTAVVGDSRNSEKSALLIDYILNLLCGISLCLHKVGNNCGINASRTCSHTDSFLGSKSHGGIYCLAAVNCGNR